MTTPPPRHHFSPASGAFTLTEVLISAFISVVIVGAVISLAIATLKIYYLDSDYIEIGGQNRRLTDNLIEHGTLADDLVIFRDISQLVAAGRGDRGDCLMLIHKSSADPVALPPPAVPPPVGFITGFHCYYLAGIPPVTGPASPTGPICLWYVKGTPPVGGETTNQVTAMNTYNRTGPRRISGEIFRGSLPRPAPVGDTPRAGIFTNDGFRNDGNPTAIVNLPIRLAARGTSPGKATSNLTFAITPRH